VAYGGPADGWAGGRAAQATIVLVHFISEQEIRSVEHGICPIAEFTSPYWIVRIVTEYRILFSVDVVMYMYCLKILSEY